MVLNLALVRYKLYFHVSTGILDLLDKMISEFDLIPNHETLTPHYLPFVKDNSNTEVARKLMEIGVTRRQVVLSVLYHLLEQSKIGDALNFGKSNQVQCN